MYKIARERALQRYRTKKAIERLVLKGWVMQESETLSITSAGTRMLDTTIERTRISLKATRWDGKWRIVAFDIPEELSALRYQVRAILKRAGFIRLQQSVWIFPHECRELSELIKSDTRLSKHVLYGVLEHVDESERLRRHFFPEKK
ncbi:CRISPR-associated endonuclease Cas2 [Candidatus Kaiserbacteria bacterium RIFCSPLOWO2_01_FULL_53_17]|uniref:CRISPR-associated endonuclease Cas2 n=1 Tax=Candidatus Kaiserbacteria bacterium RIFCSPLOWO2_01_FULL_53_17 TaxID=1798511 RepID=A0A1F6EGF2_9BACT|nr:MAG: CRISPR-associated endonuclease Cas2 [Candidatus Kaiserbacteria bacterium RIFCSPLOWO2_01_FULL_53_17]